MVVVPIGSRMIYKDHIHPTMDLVTHCKKGMTDDWFPTRKVLRCFSSSNTHGIGSRWHVLHNGTELYLKTNSRQSGDEVHNRRSMSCPKFIEGSPLKVYSMDRRVKSNLKEVSQRDKPCSESCKSGVANRERQLKVLDSYFSKLQDEVNEQDGTCMSISGTFRSNEEYQEKSSQLEQKMIVMIDKSNNLKTKMGLGSLENYFGRLNNGIDTRKSISTAFDEEYSEIRPIKRQISEEYDETTINKLNSYMPLENVDDDTGPVLFSDKNFQDLQPYDEASDFYLINLLSSINIAVFLFEIASPIKSPDVDNLSLPLIYGAKINKLILDGEWWRLVTPMFLHSGFLHVALGCWVLLTFGPQVCRGYGPFTFFLIYMLGGICGNLTSYIHTPELTVCGTGPVFAIIGAWLVYQVQNKEAIAQQVSENMFWKAVIATVMGFVLSSFGRIDDWSHLGAVFSGLIYGFLTCPTLQLDNASPENDRKSGIALVQQQADPCKSVVTFTLFILVLSSLVFVVEPELNTLELDSLL